MLKYLKEFYQTNLWSWEGFLSSVSSLFIRLVCKFLDNKGALKYLLLLENNIYKLEGSYSIKYGGGLHTKHRHTNYHAFFISNIEKGSSVLDIGCGNGALTFDIAKKVGNSKVVGVDLSEKHINEAIKKYSRRNIKYIVGDVVKLKHKEKFDVLVLSNVLEHIHKRVVFLKKLMKNKPNKVLIRVPSYERDWRVPLKEELGINHRLDNTHFVEYRKEDLVKELKEAGLKIKELNSNWGEYWVIASL